MSKSSHTKDALEYCRNVDAGKILACEFVKMACRRHLNDLIRVGRKDFPFVFSEMLSEKICNFIEKLPHVKGKWVGGNIVLQPWQKFHLSTVFGWVHKDTGHRRFKTVHIEVPRKNAKSTEAAGVCLYMLTADGEEGGEIYSAATTRDQAKIIFEIARQMTLKCPDFRDYYGVQVNAHNMNVPGTASKFEAVSAEAGSLEGLNTNMSCIDELHAHKTRAVYDVLELAGGARSQPLLWTVTTAGNNFAGICYEQRSYLTKILKGVLKDDTFFGIIYTIDEDDDWTKVSSLKKANPNYGVSVNEDDLKRLCEKAKKNSTAQNAFLTKRLNMWVNADTSWLNMVAWNKCGNTELSLDDYLGRPCYLGLDLASKVDVAALSIVFPEEDGGVTVFGKYYLPEEVVENESHAWSNHYDGWARDGIMTLTPGNIIDYEFIKNDILGDPETPDVPGLASMFEIIECDYDPFQATQFSTQLTEAGLTMVEVRPTVLNFSEPMKQMEALVLAGKFHHANDPVMKWMVSNIVCHRDKKDNIYPNKEKPENKIDVVISILMTLRRIMDTEPEVRDVYSERGVMCV